MNVELTACAPKARPVTASAQASFPTRPMGQAPCSLASKLHRVRDGLPLEAALYVGACLPLRLRGIYFDGWSAEGAVSPRGWGDVIGPLGSDLAELVGELLGSIPILDADIGTSRRRETRRAG